MSASSKFRSLPSYQKWLLGILAFVAVLYLILQLLISVFLDPYVAEKLKTGFHKSTFNAYVLEFEDLELGLLGRRIALEEVSIHPDSSNINRANLWDKIPVWGRFKTSSFSIRGIGILDMLFEKQLHIKTIAFRNPEIFVESIQKNEDQKADSGSSRRNLNRLIYKAVNTHLKSLEVDRFEITGASVNVRESGRKQGVLSLKDGMLQLSDIVIDSVSAQRDKFFITDNIEWNTGNIAWNLSGDLYTLKALATGGSSFDKTAFVDSLRLEPLYPKYEFSNTVGQQIDRIDLTVDRLAMQELSYDSLLLSRKLAAGLLDIKNAKLEIFHDKHMPAGPPSIKPLLHLTFQQMKFPVNIDTISVSDSYISYSEHNPQVPNPGTITFENLQATFAHVTNRASGSESNEPITLDAETEIMGSGLLNAHFSFALNDTSGFHTIYGSLGSMPVTALNPMLENVGFVSADDGIINSMEFSMELDKRKSTGTLTLNYENLDIKMLKKDKVQEGETRELVSFIANTFVIKKNNNENPLRNGRIEFERIEEKSIFNYWWKSLLSGLKDNVGL